MDDLSAAGLSPTEAKCYRALLSDKDWLPSELAQNVHETRTNAYKILDKLVALKLAIRLEDGKKLRFRAANPTRLIELAQEYRAKQQQAEKALELRAQQLLADYVKLHEQPGVQYFQGEAEIGAIFQKIAAAKEAVCYINTPAGIDFYGFNTMHNLRMLAPNAGVERRVITPDIPRAPRNYQKTDPLVKLQRTWFKAEDYTAPVEWGAFDDKLYIISYGKEAMGMVIESQQIATGFKQLFRLLERGQRLLPEYATLPQAARAEGVTTTRL